MNIFKPLVIYITQDMCDGVTLQTVLFLEGIALKILTSLLISENSLEMTGMMASQRIDSCGKYQNLHISLTSITLHVIHTAFVVKVGGKRNLYSTDYSTKFSIITVI